MVSNCDDNTTSVKLSAEQRCKAQQNLVWKERVVDHTKGLEYSIQKSRSKHDLSLWGISWEGGQHSKKFSKNGRLLTQLYIDIGSLVVMYYNRVRSKKKIFSKHNYNKLFSLLWKLFLVSWKKKQCSIPRDLNSTF